MGTHTRFEQPLEKPFEPKLLKEFEGVHLQSRLSGNEQTKHLEYWPVEYADMNRSKKNRNNDLDDNFAGLRPLNLCSAQP